MSSNGFGRLGDMSSPSALDANSSNDTATMTTDERRQVVELGKEFARRISGAWLLISGRFDSGLGEDGTEYLVRQLLLDAFGYPDQSGEPRPINVLLSSPGGHLDSVYSAALYLSAYPGELSVYVPGYAKSASTLLALCADQFHLSAFGELGPLDTQIADPRNPANTVSALDCYKSVDYVRDFGFKTMADALPKLVEATERRIPVNELLVTSSSFAIGAIEPLLRTITTLDFGGWGRSLRIGERYARNLLRGKEKYGDRRKVDSIAHQLVYGYTHHLFPIDLNEAERIGLDVTLMDAATYEAAIDIVNACHGKDFVGFLSEKEANEVERVRQARPERNGRARHVAEPNPDLATAEAARARSRRSREPDATQGLGDDGLTDVPDDAVPA
jgi:hypothetical protein